MSLKFFVEKKYIPDDGSVENIETFEKNTQAEILIYPDAHLKKGALIANGMLISTPHEIFLSCLGVENCGFTFGKINGITNENELINSFKNFSSILSERRELTKYDKKSILNKFEIYLKKDYVNKKFLYNYLGFKTIEDLIVAAKEILDDRLLTLAADSLCTLGGGNHFFEIHKIVEQFEPSIFKNGDYIFMLHSDSIAVGDTIYELYSDLHEMKRTGTLREKYRVLKFKAYQKKYFDKICRIYPEIKNDLKLIFSPRNDYQSIDIRTSLGKNLMLAHNLSSVFGEMNRDAIIEEWTNSQKISISKLGSHSHDNVTAELHNNQLRIVHRNGVQNIGKDEYCILPSAMGDFSYIMKNPQNEDAYYSTNHGTGRIQDKHIAKEVYTEKTTLHEIEEKQISLFRVGNGNLAEQNMHAFKEPSSIIHEMEKNNLAYKLAKTFPIAVIKG